MKKRTQKKAFTLVELLVVISIIAILAGLSFPAISSALRSAQQSGDVSNIRQLGTIMFTYASDNNFKYPPGTTVDAIIKELVDGGYLNQYDILVTPGSDQETWNGTGTISGDNISYGFMSRASGRVSDRAHPMLPLIFSSNSGLTVPPTETVSSLTAVALGDDGPWAKDGATVFRKGNSAAFLKAVNDEIGTKNENAWIPIGYDDSTTYTLVTPSTGGGGDG